MKKIYPLQVEIALFVPDWWSVSLSTVVSGRRLKLLINLYPELSFLPNLYLYQRFTFLQEPCKITKYLNKLSQLLYLHNYL
jgi:hypothetical protein